MARQKPPPQFRFELLVHIENGPTGSLLADGEAMTMGTHGEVVVGHFRKEFEAGSAPSDQAELHNRLELKRADSAMRTWEARLRNSPLDTTLQDFVAYHQDVVRRFQSWFSSHDIPLRREHPI